MENLSIIVPVHNLKNRMDNLFSWVFSPEFVQSQIILVHDTSDNQSASELRNAIKVYNNITLIEEYCNSPGEARNIGLARAQRDYVVFWDFDDSPIISEFLVFFLKFSQSGKTCGVGGFNISSGGREFKHIGLEANSLSKNKSKLMVNPGLWRWIFKRNAIGNARFISSKLAEDQFFLATLEVFDKEIFIWENAIYTYFVGDPNQLTMNKSFESTSLAVAIKFLVKFHHVKTETKMFCFVAAARIVLNQILIKKRLNITIVRLLARLGLKLIIHPRLFRSIPQIISRKNSINLNIKENVATFYFFGGLGNQLFQLAFALSRKHVSKAVFIGCSDEIKELTLLILGRSEKFKIEVIFIDQMSFLHRKLRNLAIRTSSKGSRILHELLWRSLIEFLLGVLSTFTSYRGTAHISNGTGFDEGIDVDFSSGSHIYLGYFQSHIWAENSLNEIRMGISEMFEAGNKDFESQKYDVRSSSVFVHYRLGDYLDKRNRKFGTITQSYIDRAIKILQKSVTGDCEVLVFSNDVEQARLLMQTLRTESVSLVQDNYSPLETLYLLSQGSKYVISNSTFGWWGAALSNATSKIVISPLPWFQSLEEPRGLIPKEWHRLAIRD